MSHNDPDHNELSKCIQERVKTIRFTLSLLTRDNVLDVFLDQFEHLSKDARHTYRLAAQDPEVIAAYWYLRGAAEALDLTLSQLLEEYA